MSQYRKIDKSPSEEIEVIPQYMKLHIYHILFSKTKVKIVDCRNLPGPRAGN